MLSEQSRWFLSKLTRTSPFQPATNYWRSIELCEFLARPFPQGRLLDLGCGDGKLTSILLEAMHFSPSVLVGVDIDQQETAIASSLGLYQKIYTTPANNIPEPDASFDFVFSNSVLEHIPNIHDVLAESARLTRSGGKLAITVPAPGFHVALIAAKSNHSSDRDYLTLIDQRCAHLRYWDAIQWTEELARVGFRVSYVHDYFTEREVRRWALLSNLTAGVLYKFWGQKLQPIDIQRKLGMRNRRYGVLGILMAPLAWILSLGVSTSASKIYGCLYIEATRS